MENTTNTGFASGIENTTNTGFASGIENTTNTDVGIGINIGTNGQLHAETINLTINSDIELIKFLGALKELASEFRKETLQDELRTVNDELSILRQRVKHLESNPSNHSSTLNPEYEDPRQIAKTSGSLPRHLDGHQTSLSQLCDNVMGLLVDVDPSKKDTISKSVDSLRTTEPTEAPQIKRTLVSAARALESMRLPPIYGFSTKLFHEMFEEAKQKATKVEEAKETTKGVEDVGENTKDAAHTTIRTPNLYGFHLRLGKASFPLLYNTKENHPSKLSLTIVFLGGQEAECESILKNWFKKHLKSEKAECESILKNWFKKHLKSEEAKCELKSELSFKRGSAEIPDCCISEPDNNTLCGVKLTFKVLRDKASYSRFLTENKSEAVYIVLCFQIANYQTLDNVRSQWHISHPLRCTHSKCTVAKCSHPRVPTKRPDVLLGVISGQTVDPGNTSRIDTCGQDSSYRPVSRETGYSVLEELGARAYIEFATENDNAQDVAWKLIIGHATAQGLENKRSTGFAR